MVRVSAKRTAPNAAANSVAPSRMPPITNAGGLWPGTNCVCLCLLLVSAKRVGPRTTRPATLPKEPCDANSGSFA
jgi:hypothetical protein